MSLSDMPLCILILLLSVSEKCGLTCNTMLAGNDTTQFRNDGRLRTRSNTTLIIRGDVDRPIK